LLADPLLAVAIALYILRGAWEVGFTSLNLLMDQELPENERKRIQKIALGHLGVLGIHDMRTRSSGSDLLIQFHVDTSGATTLNETHGIAESVIYKVEEAFLRAQVLIYEDPVEVEEILNQFA
jgi:ferrous-iron efflux pump FieF